MDAVSVTIPDSCLRIDEFTVSKTLCGSINETFTCVLSAKASRTPLLLAKIQLKGGAHSRFCHRRVKQRTTGMLRVMTGAPIVELLAREVDRSLLTDLSVSVHFALSCGGEQLGTPWETLDYQLRAYAATFLDYHIAAVSAEAIGDKDAAETLLCAPLLSLFDYELVRPTAGAKGNAATIVYCNAAVATFFHEAEVLHLCDNRPDSTQFWLDAIGMA